MAILIAFTVPHNNFIAVKINIDNPQIQNFTNPHSCSVKQFCGKFFRAFKIIDNRNDFLFAEHNRNPLGFFCMNHIRQVIRIFVFYKPEIKKQRRQRLILRRGTYLVFHCKFRQVLSISKNWLFAIFSRLRRVVTRWIIASYNIEFLKLPLKTEVFRGSLFIDLRLSKKFLPSILR